MANSVISYLMTSVHIWFFKY